MSDDSQADPAEQEALSHFRIYMQGLDGHRRDFKKADYWLKKAWGNKDIEHKARLKLAMLQDALEESDYAKLVKLLENAAKDGAEFAKIMLEIHHSEGRDLRKKLREEGKMHLKLAEQAAKAGDETAALLEIRKSLSSFYPSVESVEARESAKKLKEDFTRRAWERLLTKREQEILIMLLNGLAPKEIAYNLKVSNPTVNFHVNNLYKKLGIQSRAELFAKCIKKP